MSKREITLGTWEGKPIKWMVLKEEKFGTLVISKHPLFSLNLEFYSDNLWKNSNLHKYLNNDFWNKAFTDDEKKKIVNVYLADPDGTKESVFLLNISEAETLMTQGERMFGNGTNCNGHSCDSCYQYSDKHGTCCFLRTVTGNYMAVMGPPGDIRREHGNYRSVRPAMYVRECVSEEAYSAEPNEELSDALKNYFGALGKAPK